MVATTTQLGDFVRNVGGEAVEVDQILQPNTDPHDYEPRPSDVEGAAGAKLVARDTLTPGLIRLFPIAAATPRSSTSAPRSHQAAGRSSAGGIEVRPSLVA